MSNRVGIVWALPGSVPRIVGPRASGAESGGARPPANAGESTPAVRRPPRLPAPPNSRPRAGSSPGSPARPARAGGVAGSTRPDPILAARPAPRTDSVRRITEALARGPLRDGLRVRLSLRPAHLGALWIDLSMAGSRLRARVRTQTGEARDLLLAHLDELRRDLADRGIRISHFDVEIDGGRRPEEEPGTGPSPLRSHRRQVLDLDA